MIVLASNVVRVQLAIGVATGLIVLVLSAFWRWVSTHVAAMVDDTKAIKGLLVTDENGLGLVDRLEQIESNRAELIPVFDDLRRQVCELVEKADVIVDRTETLTPNGGSSMHDRISRIDDNTPDVKPGGPAHASRPSSKKAAPRKAAPRRRT